MIQNLNMIEVFMIIFGMILATQTYKVRYF